MGQYYPYAGTLTNTPIPYRKVTLGVGEKFKIPPNVAAISSNGPFSLTLPNGTVVPFGTAPSMPVSIEAMWPKGDFVITSGAGGNVAYSLYAHP